LEGRTALTWRHDVADHIPLVLGAVAGLEALGDLVEVVASSTTDVPVADRFCPQLVSDQSKPLLVEIFLTWSYWLRGACVA
jgi:hypothetical protein